MSDEECGVCAATGSMSSQNGPAAFAVTTPEKIVGIYGLRCRTTNKWYVGQSLDVGYRWNQYRLMRCKDQRKLYNAMRKYGVEDFEFVLIERCEAVDWILDYREMYWIRTLNGVVNGYNIQLGGRRGTYKHSRISIEKCRVGNLGRKLSDDHKRKIGLKSAGHTLSAEVRRIISEKCKGKVRSDDTKRRISAAMVGRRRRPFTAEHRRKIGLANLGNTGRLGQTLTAEHRQKLRNVALLREKLKREMRVV